MESHSLIGLDEHKVKTDVLSVLPDECPFHTGTGHGPASGTGFSLHTSLGREDESREKHKVLPSIEVENSIYTRDSRGRGVVTIEYSHGRGLNTGPG